MGASPLYSPGPHHVDGPNLAVRGRGPRWLSHLVQADQITKQSGLASQTVLVTFLPGQTCQSDRLFDMSGWLDRRVRLSVSLAG